jgi:hypothetical protein
LATQNPIRFLLGNESIRDFQVRGKKVQWDEKTGWPAYEKRLELGVEWIEEMK